MTLVLLVKAIIPGGAAADLFLTPVEVKGHIRDGKYVAPYASKRRKVASKPAMTDAEVDAHARGAFSHHQAKRKNVRTPPLVSHAAILGSYAAEAGLKMSDADEGRIIAAMPRVLLADYDAAKRVADKWPDGLAPHTPQPKNAAAGNVLRPEAPAPKKAPADQDGPASAEMRHFYVSAIHPDTRKKHLVAGPYASHDEAKSRVDDVRQFAHERDPWSHFMLWGTAGSEQPIRTPLGEGWTTQHGSAPLKRPDAPKAKRARDAQ